VVRQKNRGREYLVEQSYSPQGFQEAERERERKKVWVPISLARTFLQ
jgi:hypothetical protein